MMTTTDCPVEVEAGEMILHGFQHTGIILGGLAACYRERGRCRFQSVRIRLNITLEISRQKRKGVRDTLVYNGANRMSPPWFSPSNDGGEARIGRIEGIFGETNRILKRDT